MGSILAEPPRLDLYRDELRGSIIGLTIIVRAPARLALVL
jgi:hypothetical protein